MYETLSGIYAWLAKAALQDLSSADRLAINELLIGANSPTTL
jgi:hypothetical protein